MIEQEPETHTYRLPAPFGSIVFGMLSDGEFFSLRPSLEVIREPDPAPESISRWMNLTDKILSEYACPNEEDYKDLVALRAVREGLSDFAVTVLKAVAALDRNELITYTELAERIGHPSAARAVARALAQNPFPILIPCHRVASRELLETIDVTDIRTLTGSAYLGESRLAPIAAWLRLHDQTFL